MPRNQLVDFMQQLQAELSAEYARIQVRTKEDPGTAGDEGEENWAALLRNWLPSSYHVVTKGRILSFNGEASPQVDILVLHPAYPKHLLNKKHYLAGGVLAAFECKLTLRNKHLPQVFKNCATIKGLVPRRKGTPYREIQQPLIYGLLAHSHSWKAKGADAAFDLVERIEDYQFHGPQHPWEMLDIICVADTANYSLNKGVLIGPAVSNETKAELQEQFGANEGVSTGYFFFWHDEEKPLFGTVLGAFICELMEKLAYEDMSIRSIAEYYPKTGIHGGSIGRTNLWKSIELSPQVLRTLRRKGTSDERWGEWAMYF